MSETSPALLPRVAVDIWSDVVCPWCAIGYTQFAKALKELDGEIEVEVRWMPFELIPTRRPKAGIRLSTSPRSTIARPSSSPRCARIWRRWPSGQGSR